MRREKARNNGGIGLFGVVAILLLASVAVAGFMSYDLYTDITNPKTKTLTIMHTWEEGGKYYFADEVGCVYKMDTLCKGDFWKEGEILYDNLPKTRFEKLEEGQNYRVEYVVITQGLIMQKNVRLSLGEEEVER